MLNIENVFVLYVIWPPYGGGGSAVPVGVLWNGVRYLAQQCSGPHILRNSLPILIA